jgi:hypothetical protein
MYARLYWSAFGDTRDYLTFFKETGASWKKMKKGFNDLMLRHPKSIWNLNNFAKFSCIANDSKTFLKLRRQMGKNVIQDAWPQNISLDFCDQKFGYAT